MGKLSDLMISLQEEITEGFMSFEDIAAKYDVPLEWVIEAGRQLEESEL